MGETPHLQQLSKWAHCGVHIVPVSQNKENNLKRWNATTIQSLNKIFKQYNLAFMSVYIAPTNILSDMSHETKVPTCS